jgi:two-component system response regulator
VARDNVIPLRPRRARARPREALGADEALISEATRHTAALLGDERSIREARPSAPAWSRRPLEKRPTYILLVEDDADEATLIRRALAKGRMRCNVVVVEDLNGALEQLFGAVGQHELPGLVLLDLESPIGAGLELLRELRTREATRFLPVILLSSSNEVGEIRKAYEAGATSYVHKPVGFERFVELMDTLGAFWLGVNTPTA